MDPVEHILPLSTIILCVRLSHLEVAGGARRIGWLAFSLDDGETELWCHCPSTLSIEQQNADQLGPIGMILSTFFQFYPIWIWCQEKLLRVNVWEIYFFGAAEDPRVDFGPADGTTLLAMDVYDPFICNDWKNDNILWLLGRFEVAACEIGSIDHFLNHPRRY